VEVELQWKIRNSKFLLVLPQYEGCLRIFTLFLRRILKGMIYIKPPYLKFEIGDKLHRLIFYPEKR
jgi:hypothetical protein